MELFRTFYLFYLSAAFIKCAPIENDTSLYGAILQKCPTVTLLPNFKNQPIFRTCNDWVKINKTQELTDKTKIDVLCLLYFTSFTQYCNQSKPINTSLGSVVNVEMNTICDNLDIIPKQVAPDAALRKMITTKNDCEKLCGDGFGLVTPICSASYHYSHPPENEKSSDYMLSAVKPNANHLLTVPPAKKPNPPASPAPEVQVQQLSSQREIPQMPDKTSIQESQNKEEIRAHNDPVAVNNVEVHGKVNDQPEQATINVNKNSPQVSGGGQISEINHENSATNDALKQSAEGVNKSDNNAVKSDDKVKNIVTKEKDTVPGQQKPVLAPTSPRNEENANIDGNQLDKNTNKLVDDDFVPSDEGNQANNEFEEDMDQPSDTLNEKPPKPNHIEEDEEADAVNFTTEMDGDSYFFTYFMLLCIIFIVGYVCYHNKQKILALILEGRRGKRQYRGRRPNSANYHKLDNNLEEAITSSCNKNTNNVIY